MHLTTRLTTCIPSQKHHGVYSHTTTKVHPAGGLKLATENRSQAHAMVAAYMHGTMDGPFSDCAAAA
jgi:hypothetical protein